jgi:hypothetical protein
MAYSPQQIEQAMNAKGAGGVCPGCGGNDWSFAETAYRLMALDADRNVDVDHCPGLDVVAVGCNRCAFVRLHGMNVLGI